MENLYERVHAWSEEEKREAWEQWVWKSDCNAPPLEECCDMNRMHGFGILCCLHEAAVPCAAYHESLETLVPTLPAVHVHENKRISEFSLRELVDQVECMQLNWGQIIVFASQERSEALVKGIMARLGFIASHAFEYHKPEDGYEGLILDDPQYITLLPHNMAIISRKALRQLICTLVGMVRVLHIVQRAVAVPPYSSERLNESIIETLKQHHIEASMDFFNSLQQLMHLAPAMRLVYRTNFAGMYNDVSQVIYYHYPKYARQPQKTLQEMPYSTMHLLPLIRELLPDIPVMFDDDSQILGLTTSEATEANRMGWLVSCGTVFLVEGATIYRSDTLLDMVCFFLEKTGRQLVVEQQEDKRLKRRKVFDPSQSEHGHVQLLRPAA